MTWGVKRSVFAALPYSVQARTLLAVVTGGDPQDVIAPALTDNLGLAALYRLLLDHVRLSCFCERCGGWSGAHA